MSVASRPLAVRAVAIAMGFVFFMGAWRRFINVPAKHDVDSAQHLAGKLMQAAPGSPIEDAIHWVLSQPLLAEWSVYLMSPAEAAVGLALMAGLLTRLAAVGAGLLNVALMLIFGWMGHECLDEWTMAALGFAISVTVLIHGSGGWSLDARFGRDPFADWITPPAAAVLVAVSTLFTVGFYGYYFGITELHKRTSTGTYSIAAEPTGRAGTTRLYVDAGGSSGAAYVRGIEFTLADGSTRRQSAADIAVEQRFFEPWAQSGEVVDGVLKLRLGSKTDIRIPEDARSARVDLIDNPDPRLTL